MAKSGLIAAVAVLLLLPAGPVPAQGLWVNWYTVNAGGRPGSGPGYTVNGSTGQAVQGPAARPQIQGHWGFWYGERVEVGPPPPPIPIAPPNGSNVGTTTPRLVVREVAMATAYEFRVYEGASLVTEGISETRSWVVDTELEIGKVYHWDCAVRVRGLWSPHFEPCWSFKVVETPWPYGWVEVAPVPAEVGNSRTMVRRGSWLAIAPGPGGQPWIYAVKGGRQHNLYRYNPLTSGNGTWEELDSTPVPVDQASGRPIDRGCRGIGDGERYIYVMHGNNSSAFWRFDIEHSDPAEAWARMEDVPLAPSGRRPRGGGYMVHVPGEPGYIYVMKGDRQDFYRYDPALNTWEERAPMPVGPRGRWHRGSWLAFDGENAIYAHQAKDFHRAAEPEHCFWKYDIGADAWAEETLAGMPLLGLHGNRLRRKRARDGGSGVFHPDDGMVYALKGGNTQQFWVYEPDGAGPGGLWAESDTMPSRGSTGRRRRVNAGGYLTHYEHGSYRGFFAFKGNKTQEFWRYVMPPEGGIETGFRPERSGVMAGDGTAEVPFVDIGPNPLMGGFANLRYGLPGAGAAKVTVYDASGRPVATVRTDGRRAAGSVSLDLRSLSAGVYLVRFEADSFRAAEKLVVPR